VAGGYPIYHEAYENIVERRMTMELSMAIAIVAALAIRETFTALVITASELAFILNSTRLIPSGRVMRDRLLARDA
jgi:cation transport ATPase